MPLVGYSEAWGWASLCLATLVLAGISVCVAIIVRKAGYSPHWAWPTAILFAWGLVPEYLLMTAVTRGDVSLLQHAYDWWHDYTTFGFFVWLLDAALFLLFTVLRWPVHEELELLRARFMADRDERRRELLLAAGLASGTVTAHSVRIDLPDRAATGPDPAVVDGAGAEDDAAGRLAAAEEPTHAFCSWCGVRRELPTHALHHCGPRWRAPVYCSRCGAVLAGAEACGGCGTPASVRSPR